MSNIIEIVNNELSILYNENNDELKTFNDYKFIKERLECGLFEDISTDRQRDNGTLKVKFKHIRRIGNETGSEINIIFGFYPLSGNIIRDDKNYIFEGIPGFTSKVEAIKKFIYYFYFKFIINPKDFDEFKKEMRKCDN